ncbi:MAG: hypothetical protein HKN80_09345 [Acidimicrobiia bacterium]|nr:hypothetical protein [Acidimicrobiia bacterium]
MPNDEFQLYGNRLKPSHARKAAAWQDMFIKKFDYDPDEHYTLSLQPNQYLGDIFGMKDVVRGDEGEPIAPDSGVVLGTVRMGYGHYRIAMAGASAAASMGYTPLWLDMLTTPGITSDVINWWNTEYSKYSRLSQRSGLFEKYVWEPITTGNKTLPGLSWLLNNTATGFPWRFLKANARDYRKSELFANLHAALPSDIPILTAHMWNCMGAVAGGMTNVVDMMFDNWPMAFQLTEGAKHGVQSPSGYYGFRVMNGFDEDDAILNPVPPDALHYVGHHVDHELVENIEVDNADRLRRMRDGEPRRLMITMGGAGAQRELFHSVIEHCLPMIERGEVTLFVNLGDHRDNWNWLEGELASHRHLVETHLDWDDTRGFADEIRTSPASGLHVFLHDNTFHGVYASNYLMRVVDVMITKPSELAFYPIPKIFNARVGGHEAWGAIRSAELGDGTIETRSIPRTLQAIDLLSREEDLMEMYCEAIVKNKSIGIYDGAYKCVALATGTTWER